MNITYLSPTGTIGGAEMCLLDILAELRAARPDWRLSVVLGDDGPLRPAVEDLGVACAVLPLPKNVAAMGDAGLGGWRRGLGGLRLVARGPAAAVTTSAYLVKLRRLLRDLEPDVVQTNGMKAHILGAWAAPRGVPVVWHLHDYLGSRRVMSRLLRLSARRQVRAVAVSESVASDARGVLGPGLPLRAIHNAVDLDRFRPGPGDGPALDRAAGLPEAAPGTVRVGLVATFARWKGHEVFLEAAARIPSDRPCRLYVVGGPIYRSTGSQYSLEELRALAERLGLSGRVGFTGHQTDPAAALRALDVVVHASIRPEPFGRVIVEAMACGRPVVAVPDGGAAELFEDGVSALGVPGGDPDSLAAALDRLVGDPDLRRRLGERGREATVRQFGRARLAEEWSVVYDACVNPKTRSFEPETNEKDLDSRARSLSGEALS